MELIGKVKVVMDKVTFDSGFTKREFVVTTKEQYPQDIKFELVQDRVALLDSIKDGDDVTVFFDVRGNEYNGRYFVNLRGWKLEKGNTASNSTTSSPMPEAPDPFTGGGGDEADDLPF